MTRTQIILEEWQYQELKKLAEKEGTSLSAMVRSMLSRMLRPQESEQKRLSLVGLFADEGGEVDHDEILYSGKDK